jgi:3-hydroxyacyl-[acyl-carrier-protein] dehydratase
VVAHGIYLLGSDPDRPRMLTLFTDATVEFNGVVRPGQRVITRGKKLVFRRLFLRSAVEMTLEDGTVVCSGTLAGMGVPA